MKTASETTARSAARAGAYGVVVDGVRSRLHLTSWRTTCSLGTTNQDFSLQTADK
ncbi:hypothetical protein HMPREF1129_0249 [Actinomyces naeslundii str. Howell 279]|uniref:Uncharacterized protein n=1 Tax=Actinomyces naeslundii (strain ATCC 12104 / DSM 43013 / CCUG 2238 / JCM 8349 / NCTC 10301 / Howell 279) TaxID=1115803 RepID=J3JKR2_ACTNH|nr:hypothetical protein HMPREF1129_0249 [Actinomyces naeslundii str. Howell 279]